MNYSQGKPSDEEVIEIVRVLQSGGYLTEVEDDEKISFLVKYYPGISDLIFWDNRNLTPEEILEEAKKKIKPIIL